MYRKKCGKKNLSVAIIDLRFDGNTCEKPAAKLTFTLNFKVNFLFALYSTYQEGKTFSYVVTL